MVLYLILSSSDKPPFRYAVSKKKIESPNRHSVLTSLSLSKCMETTTHIHCRILGPHRSSAKSVPPDFVLRALAGRFFGRGFKREQFSVGLRDIVLSKVHLLRVTFHVLAEKIFQSVESVPPSPLIYVHPYLRKVRLIRGSRQLSERGRPC